MSQVAYVASAGDRTIHVLALDSSGKVALIEQVEVPGPDQVEPISLPLAVSADRRFLYAAIRTAPFPVVTFAIDQRSGKLRYLGTANQPDQMAYIAPDRTNRVLLCACYVGSKLAVMPIDADGVIRRAASQVFAAPKAHSIIPSLDNRSAYVALHGGDVVLQYALDLERGRLTPMESGGAPTAKDAGPRHLVLHAPTRRLFVVNERNGSVDTMAIADGSEGLSPLASVSMLPRGYTQTPTAADIRVTANGRFVYATERTASFITVFTAEKDGRLTPVEWVKTEESPRGFAIDTTDRYVLVVGQSSGGLSVYSINQATGRLTQTDQRAVGSNPNWVEVLNIG